MGSLQQLIERNEQPSNTESMLKLNNLNAFTELTKDLNDRIDLCKFDKENNKRLLDFTFYGPLAVFGGTLFKFLTLPTPNPLWGGVVGATVAFGFGLQWWYSDTRHKLFGQGNAIERYGAMKDNFQSLLLSDKMENDAYLTHTLGNDVKRWRAHVSDIDFDAPLPTDSYFKSEWQKLLRKNGQLAGIDYNEIKPELLDN